METTACLFHLKSRYSGVSLVLDRVSVPSPIAVEKLMDTINGEGHISHVPVFCVNFERHICTHITTSILALPVFDGLK